MEKYSVSVEPAESVVDEHRGGIETWKVYYEAARVEYEYAHANSTKLDNKVYILLTVCAFLFPMLCSAQMEAFGQEVRILFVKVLIKYSILGAKIGILAVIVLLLIVLRTTQIARVDVFANLQEKNGDEDTHLEALKRFAWLYASFRQAGVLGQDKKYRYVDWALGCLIFTFLAIAFSSALSFYFTIAV